MTTPTYKFNPHSLDFFALVPKGKHVLKTHYVSIFHILPDKVFLFVTIITVIEK
jgi:hypothetical protein